MINVNNRNITVDSKSEEHFRNLFYNGSRVEIIHKYSFFNLVKIRSCDNGSEYIVDHELIRPNAEREFTISIKILGGLK